jgi:dihydrodipicolinate synthase/N-acetylneuraminate lyase
VTPYYNRPNLAGLQRHFIAVADETILYDVPHRTGVTLSDSLIVELSRHRNIVGLKDATGDIPRGVRLLTSLPPDFRIVSGDDSTSFALMAAGASG